MSQIKLSTPYFRLNRIIYNLIDAIEYIHSINYMHRDIKPENIVFFYNVPKICDFGLTIKLKNN